LQDFVEIKTTPKGKRVLTEHQKEVMKKQHQSMPAMYNNLDVSQDVSLSTQLSLESQPER